MTPVIQLARASQALSEVNRQLREVLASKVECDPEAADKAMQYVDDQLGRVCDELEAIVDDLMESVAEIREES